LLPKPNSALFIGCDFSRKLKEAPKESLLPAFIKGAIISSLTTVFGEIGGQTDVDLLTFDESKQKGILRVQSDFLVKVRAALTLISNFQGIPAIFQVNQSTQQLSSLTDSFIEI